MKLTSVGIVLAATLAVVGCKDKPPTEEANKAEAQDDTAPLLSGNQGLGFFCTFGEQTIGCFCQKGRTDEFWSCDGMDEKCRILGGGTTCDAAGVCSCGAPMPNEGGGAMERLSELSLGEEEMGEHTSAALTLTEEPPALTEKDLEAASTAQNIVSSQPEPAGWCQGDASETKCECRGEQDCKSMKPVCDVFVGGQMCCTAGTRSPVRCACISGHQCSASTPRPQ